MEKVFNNLATLLEGQKEIYEELLSLAKLKQTELVKGSIEILDNLNKQEEILVLRVGRLEEERFKCTNDLIDTYGLDKEVALRDLIEAAPTDIKEILEKLQKSMTDLLKQLEKINNENMDLIKQSLRFIHFSLETLTQQTQTTYTADRAMKVENLTKLLDKKV